MKRKNVLNANLHGNKKCGSIELYAVVCWRSVIVLQIDIKTVEITQTAAHIDFLNQITQHIRMLYLFINFKLGTAKKTIRFLFLYWISKSKSMQLKTIAQVNMLNVACVYNFFLSFFFAKEKKN